MARSGASELRHRVYCWSIRGGFVARGVTYGIIAVLTLALALGARPHGDTPNQEGALVLLARTPLGHPALVAVAAGLLAYAVWKLQHGVLARGPGGRGSGRVYDRISNLGGAAAYIAFFVVALEALTGSVGHSATGPRDTAAGVLGWPAGPELVALAGLILIGVSLIQVLEAVRGKFARDCDTAALGRRRQHTFMALGRVGLVARAAVFVLVGYFLVRTAVEFDPRSAVGLDGALARLQRQPLGPWLVGLAATGLMVFSLFSLVEARYRQL